MSSGPSTYTPLQPTLRQGRGCVISVWLMCVHVWDEEVLKCMMKQKCDHFTQIRITNYHARELMYLHLLTLSYLTEKETLVCSLDQSRQHFSLKLLTHTA